MSFFHVSGRTFTITGNIRLPRKQWKKITVWRVIPMRRYKYIPYTNDKDDWFWCNVISFSSLKSTCRTAGTTRNTMPNAWGQKRRSKPESRMFSKHYPNEFNHGQIGLQFFKIIFTSINLVDNYILHLFFTLNGVSFNRDNLDICRPQEHGLRLIG